MSRRRAGAVAAALLAGALVLVPTAAFAHDALVASDPEAGSTVATLEQVVLTFNADPIDAEGADVVQVVGPDGRHYETGCPALTGPDVATPVALGPAGDYRVQWRIVSSDGHPVSGDLSFTYRPAAGATAAAGATGPACASASGDAQDEGRDGAQTAPADSGLWVGLGIGAVVLVGVAVGVWLLLRRPRRSTDD